MRLKDFWRLIFFIISFCLQSLTIEKESELMDLLEYKFYSRSFKQQSDAQYFGSNSSVGSKRSFTFLSHHDFHFPLMPHWNTTGVEWLWWTTRDYGNNTLVKSSWNHPPHADSNVNIPWSDGCTLCVCLHWGDHSNVCSAGTCRGQSVLGLESHGCMKV